MFPDGHNEAEFGMSWCAGFGGSFYNAYFEVFWFPLSFFPVFAFWHVCISDKLSQNSKDKVMGNIF